MSSDETEKRAGIAARIRHRLADRAAEIAVAEVRIGLGYTAVVLADRRAGVAYTFRDQARGGCSVFDRLRPLAGRPASELLPLIESRDVIEAAVGLACANALVGPDIPAGLPGDVLDRLDVRPDDRVAMVGNFGPLVEPLRRRARSLTIFERSPAPAAGLRPPEAAVSELPGCQVALVTATSIINHTLDGLLEVTGGCRQVVLLGASTPLIPEVFAGSPVTMLSGVTVVAPEPLLQVVSEGGGMRQFRPHVRKVTIEVTPGGRKEPTDP